MLTAAARRRKADRFRIPLAERKRRPAADYANYADADLGFIRQRANLHPGNSHNPRLVSSVFEWIIPTFTGNCGKLLAVREGVNVMPQTNFNDGKVRPDGTA